MNPCFIWCWVERPGKPLHWRLKNREEVDNRYALRAIGAKKGFNVITKLLFLPEGLMALSTRQRLISVKTV